jgi:hypothetical protein
MFGRREGKEKMVKIYNFTIKSYLNASNEGKNEISQTFTNK